MDNEQPSQDVQPREPTVDWASYHENNQQDIDVGAFTDLVRRVGGELQKIDSQSVSGSTRKAEQIDKQKLIRELSSNKPPPPEAPAQAPPPVARQSAPVLPPLHQPVAVKPNAPIPQTPQLDDLEKRIARLESANRSFRKAKKIKRGASYRISSNSVKGVVKDASIVAEFVISELAKGVKSITIKLDESTDT